MKKRKFYLLISLLLFASMIFTAVSICETGNTYKGRKIAEQIVIGNMRDPWNLDPANLHGNENIFMVSLFMEGLVQTNDEGTEIEPGLAESWEISDDELTYTFHMKPGVKFSNGEPVLGEDWVWSILRARDSIVSPYTFSAEAIENIIAPDDETVVITLKEPWAPILADLAMCNLVVQDKSYHEEVGEVKFSQIPVGTGPYLIKEWKKGEYLLFEKNPYYHKEGLPITQKIKFVTIEDNNTRILQLESGQTDAINFVPFNRMEDLNKNSDLKTIGMPSTEVMYAIFNNNVKPLDQRKVRLALQYGTDKQELINFVLCGYGKIAIGFAPPSGLFYNDQLVDYGYDVNKAKDLLAEAGYPDGFEVELLIQAGWAVYEQMAVILKQQWSKIGVTVNILSLEAEYANAKRRTMGHEIILAEWTDDISDPAEIYDYVCKYETAKNYSTGWINMEVDALVEKALRELDPEKRKQEYFKIQEIFHQEVPLMPIFCIPYSFAMKNGIEGFVQTPLGEYRFEELVLYVD